MVLYALEVMNFKPYLDISDYLPRKVFQGQIEVFSSKGHLLLS